MQQWKGTPPENVEGTGLVRVQALPLTLMLFADGGHKVSTKEGRHALQSTYPLPLAAEASYPGFVSLFKGRLEDPVACGASTQTPPLLRRWARSGCCRAGSSTPRARWASR